MSYSDDQRASERRRSEAESTLTVLTSNQLEAGKEIRAEITDISESGIGLRLGAELASGDRVSVLLSPPNSAERVTLEAEVRWCSGTGGMNQMGLRFTDDATLRSWRNDLFPRFFPA